jgi:CRISPR-associated protein Cmr2
MGKFISNLELEQHKELSRGLSEFASQVERVLSGTCEAMPVFAGGDDVLALLPLHRLLEGAQAVRDEFRGRVTATLSAGIAIVHAYEPLDEAREMAKCAKDKAKEIRVKDALLITVAPRSGAPVHATGKWDAMLVSLREIVAAYKEKRLSFGFAHELRELLDRTPGEVDDVLPDLARALAARKRQESPAASKLVENASDRRRLQELMERLLVARKLARAEQEAE